MVLALQDKLAYGPTFEAALSALYGNSAPSLTGGEGAKAPAGGPAAAATTAPVEDVKTLAAEASRDFGEYQRLTAAGKLGEAGQKLDALRQVLERLNARAK